MFGNRDEVNPSAVGATYFRFARFYFERFQASNRIEASHSVLMVHIVSGEGEGGGIRDAD